MECDTPAPFHHNEGNFNDEEDEAGGSSPQTDITKNGDKKDDKQTITEHEQSGVVKHEACNFPEEGSTENGNCSVGTSDGYMTGKCGTEQLMEPKQPPMSNLDITNEVVCDNKETKAISDDRKQSVGSEIDSGTKATVAYPPTIFDGGMEVRDDKQTITEQEQSGVVKHEACNSPEEGSTENGNCSVVVCDNKETQAISDDRKQRDDKQTITEQEQSGVVKHEACNSPEEGSTENGNCSVVVCDNKETQAISDDRKQRDDKQTITEQEQSGVVKHEACNSPEEGSTENGNCSVVVCDNKETQAISDDRKQRDDKQTITEQEQSGVVKHEACNSPEEGSTENGNCSVVVCDNKETQAISDDRKQRDDKQTITEQEQSGVVKHEACNSPEEGSTENGNCSVVVCDNKETQAISDDRKQRDDKQTITEQEQSGVVKHEACNSPEEGSTENGNCSVVVCDNKETQAISDDRKQRDDKQTITEQEQSGVVKHEACNSPEEGSTENGNCSVVVCDNKETQAISDDRKQRDDKQTITEQEQSGVVKHEACNSPEEGSTENGNCSVVVCDNKETQAISDDRKQRDDKQTITEQEQSGVVKHEACNSPEEGSTENGNCSVVVCDNKETQAISDDRKQRDDKQTITEQEQSGVVKHEACNSPEEGSTENGNCSVVVCDNKETQAISDDRKQRELASLRTDYESLVGGLQEFIRENSSANKDKENKRSTDADHPLSAQVKYVFDCMTEKHVSELQDRLTQFKKDESRLNGKISALNNKDAVEVQKRADLSFKLDKAKFGIKEKDEKIIELQSDCEKMKSRISKQTDKLQSTTDSFSKEKRSLKGEIDYLKASTKQNENNIKGLKKELEKQMKDNEKSKKEIKNKEDEITKLNTQQMNMKRDMTQKNHEISLLNNEKKRLSSELNSAIQQLNDQFWKLHDKDTHIQGMERQTNEFAKTIRELEDDKSTLTLRLSKLAGAQLTTDNPNITDLSDMNRPTKLAEKYSELYDNEWTDAFEESQEKWQMGEIECVNRMLHLLKVTNDECVKMSQPKTDTLKNMTMVTVKVDKTPVSADITSISNTTSVNRETQTAMDPTDGAALQTELHGDSAALQTELDSDAAAYSQSDSKLHGDNGTKEKEEPMATSESNTEHVADALHTTSGPLTEHQMTVSNEQMAEERQANEAHMNQDKLKTGQAEHASNTNTADNLGKEIGGQQDEATPMYQDKLQTGQAEHESNTNTADNLGKEIGGQQDEATPMYQDKLQTGQAEHESNTNTADNLGKEIGGQQDEATPMYQDKLQTGQAEHESNTNTADNLGKEIGGQQDETVPDVLATNPTPEDAADAQLVQKKEASEATPMYQDKLKTGQAEHESNTNTADNLGKEIGGQQDETVLDVLATNPTPEDAADAQLVQKKEASEVTADVTSSPVGFGTNVDTGEVKVDVPMDLPLGFGTNVDTGEVTGEVEIKHEFTAEQKKIVSELIKVCGAKLEEEGNISQVIARKVAFEKGIDPKTNERTFAYIARCAHICWYMAIQDPPVVIGFHELEGDAAFEKDTYKAYTKVGKNLDFVVWPPLYLHKGGAMLSKGTAQGKN